MVHLFMQLHLWTDREDCVRTGWEGGDDHQRENTRPHEECGWLLPAAELNPGNSREMSLLLLQQVWNLIEQASWHSCEGQQHVLWNCPVHYGAAPPIAELSLMVYASHRRGVQPSVFCMSDRKQTVTLGLTYMSQLPRETEVVATGAGPTHSTRMSDASMSSDLACPCPTHFHQKFSHAQEYSLKYLLLKSTVLHQCLVTSK